MLRSKFTVTGWACGSLLLASVASVACGDDEPADTNSGAGRGGGSGEGSAGKAGAGGKSSGGSAGKAGSSGAGTGGKAGATSTGGTAGASGGSAGEPNGGVGGDQGGASGEAGAAGDGPATSGGQGGASGEGGAGGESEGGAGGEPVRELVNATGNGWPADATNEAVDKAFDRRTDRKWVYYGLPAWAQYEFLSAPESVQSYAIVSGNDVPARDPRSWTLLGNNTGPDADETSDSEWTVLDTRTDQGPFPARDTRYTFNATTPGSFKFYRLKVTANHGDPGVQLTEIELFATPGVNLIQGSHGSEPSPGGESIARAFDGNPATKWFTWTNPSWLQYEFRRPKSVESYVLVSANDEPTRDPSSWQLLANNSGPDANESNDSEWTVLDTQSNQGPFAERRSRYAYPVATPGAFRFYRLKVTSSGASMLQLAELELLARD